MTTDASMIDEITRCVRQRFFYTRCDPKENRHRKWPFMNRYFRAYYVLILSAVPFRKTKGRKRTREIKTVFEEEIPENDEKEDDRGI